MGEEKSRYQKLYRFEPLENWVDDEEDPKMNKRRIETVREGSIWMSIPDNFNDPFDARHTITNSAPGMIPELLCAIRSLYAGFSKNATQEQKERIEVYERLRSRWILDDRVQRELIKLVDSTGDRYLNDSTLPDSIADVLRSYRMTCFNSTGISSPLMWAHYGRNHQGFCVEYEVDLNAKENWVDYSLQSVVYSSRFDYKTLTDALLQPEKFVNWYCWTKSVDWSYEKEHRLVCFDYKSEGLHKLPEGLRVSAIHIGANCDPRHERLLLETCRELSITPFKMNVNPELFEINSEVVDS
ncbi:hypothetical protein GCM10011297_35260 [Bacterioplanes sanyensis]|uniref:DUF2971 domain-containing protein n=1 Tax=Bacterioplanes sanyensis TaxID=1249553 RepID=UPI00167AF2D1|nr:DUF2971 domain-containing protein [Bacterioplanes sanyensis]GGY59830.1 hypothetical protein GCM10011297_35260 [Bacterioplanes sanyensis]